MRHTKIEGHPDLIRDVKTNAILNNNKSEYEKYIIASRVKKVEKTKVEKIEEELDTLKEDITEIKDLLKTVLSKFQ
jgi:formiminotetrahydrofolate cyclodeaminase